MNEKLVSILLVEDNPGDADLVRKAIETQKVLVNLEVVESGEDALERLHASDPPNVDVILLDLNLPGMDGREVLKIVKSDPALRTIPIVVLTSSRAETDIARSYDLQANCFITKPVDFDDFMTVVKSIETFWVKLVKLPPAKRRVS